MMDAVYRCFRCGSPDLVREVDLDSYSAVKCLACGLHDAVTGPARLKLARVKLSPVIEPEPKGLRAVPR